MRGRARGHDAVAFACVAALSLVVLAAEPREGGPDPRAEAAAASSPRGPETTWVEREALLMGTSLRIRAAAGSRDGAARAIEAALDSVDALEGRLSSWREEADLGRLRSRGRTSLHPSTARLLAEARSWTRRTDGAFDPSVGALVETWDLRGDGRRPTGSELEAGLRSSGWDCLRLDVGARKLSAACDGAWIDAGAFGKGAALAAGLAALRAAGATAGLLDFGGQLAVFGASRGTERTSGPGGGAGGWEVSVAHPEARGRPAVRLEIPGGSVATTSASERFVVVRDTVRGHVIDPRTGDPAPAWGSVTVHAADPLAADVLSTALFVMGADEGRAWAEAHEGVAALFLRPGPGGLDASWDAEMEAMILEAPDGARPGRGARSGADRGATHRDRDG